MNIAYKLISLKSATDYESIRTEKVSYLYTLFMFVVSYIVRNQLGIVKDLYFHGALEPKVQYLISSAAA